MVHIEYVYIYMYIYIFVYLEPVIVPLFGDLKSPKEGPNSIQKRLILVYLYHSIFPKYGSFRCACVYICIYISI